MKLNLAKPSKITIAKFLGVLIVSGLTIYGAISFWNATVQTWVAWKDRESVEWVKSRNLISTNPEIVKELRVEVPVIKEADKNEMKEELKKEISNQLKP